MKELIRNVVSMNRVSEANPDGEFWPVVFVAGCNLRCPYCMNVKIVEKPVDQFIPMAEVLCRLEEWGEPGVMISGGEFLMGHLDAENLALIKALSAGGRKVGISTNGMSPGKLMEALHNPAVAFVALDCKFGIDNLDEDANRKAGLIGLSCGSDMVDNIHCSLGCVSRWHDSNPDAKSEVRMTMYPPLVGQDDVFSVAKRVHPKSKLVLQNYRKNKQFNGEINPVEPYPDEEISRIRSLVENCIGVKTEIRWP